MIRFGPLLLITGMVVILPSIACANAGAAIFYQFGIHFVLLTWTIGLGEGLLLYILFRVWRLRSGTFRIFISMIAANVTSAWLGMLFVKNRYAAQIMGDVTIENLIPAFWTMVYVTFVLTMIIEFPFFLVALYGRKWLIPKAVATILIAHGISYTLLFYWYSPDYVMNMVTELEVVPASSFEIKEDYDLYYISQDRKYVLRSDLTGNNKEVVATLDMDGVPDRLCAYPRKVVEEIQEGKEKEGHKTVSRVCWESGFDLYVLMNVDGVYKTRLLCENFSPQSAVALWDGVYKGYWDTNTDRDHGNFRSFGNTTKWIFFSEYWPPLLVYQVKSVPHTSAEKQSGFTLYPEGSFYTIYQVQTPFIQWPVRNGTDIAGDYGVFLLGKDQICILDPEKKRIALIARGFGPVVAKPPLEEIPEITPEETNEQTANEVP
ncbi:MAG: hypothetical protein GXY07_04285 [Candidatus Hydrogenedentes bacterium]|nr:hypothetical protein [Candidatus Hydrogenedentota bacterium]